MSPLPMYTRTQDERLAELMGRDIKEDNIDILRFLLSGGCVNALGRMLRQHWQPRTCCRQDVSIGCTGRLTKARLQTFATSFGMLNAALVYMGSWSM